MSADETFLDVAAVFPRLRDSAKGRFVITCLETLLALRQVRRLFASVPVCANPFAELVLRFRLRPILSSENAQLPQEGGLLVVSNHPSGGSDALVLCGEVIAQRPDTLVMVNEMLSRSRALQSVIIPVSIMDSANPEQKARNLKSMKQTMSHLRQGGCVLIFPAGEVSRWQWAQGKITDGEWSEHIAMLAQRSGASVVPAWVNTANPPWFYVLAALSGIAAAAVLPLCLYLARGSAVKFAFGEPIASAALRAVNAKDAILSLRAASDALADHF